MVIEELFFTIFAISTLVTCKNGIPLFSKAITAIGINMANKYFIVIKKAPISDFNITVTKLIAIPIASIINIGT